MYKFNYMFITEVIFKDAVVLDYIILGSVSSSFVHIYYKYIRKADYLTLLWCNPAEQHHCLNYKTYACCMLYVIFV